MASGAKDTDAQVPPTRATGPESATGMALQADKEIPQGKDRGSQVEPEGGHPAPDVEGPQASGAQLEPARFTSNGQLPHNIVPTPSGPVPAGALGLSPEDTQARVDEVNQAHDDYVNRRISRQFLAPETVQRLSAAELRAIGQSRGYSIPESGTRSTRAAFIEAQDNDDQVQKPKKSKKSSASDASSDSDTGSAS